jgi:uncharacterized protein
MISPPLTAEQAAPPTQNPPPTPPAVDPARQGGAGQAAPPAGQAAPAAGRRGGGRGGDPFAGQPRLRALVVSGGCCHDYPTQAKVTMDVLRRAAPVDWTVTYEGGTGTSGKQPVYEKADWAKGFDVVIHNECFAQNGEESLINTIIAAHKAGVPAIVLHCAMHSYQSAPNIEGWREFLGVTTVRHTRAHNIAVKTKAADHPIMQGFVPEFTTPTDELYVITRLWPKATALASAVSPEPDGLEYPVAWVNDYNGTRIFGTTLGHNETWNDANFQDLLSRGFKWVLKR